MSVPASIMLNGSVVLRRIFAAQNEINVNRAGLLISPISLASPAYDDNSIASLLAANDNGYIAVDMYNAAALSLYKLGDRLYTATEKFRRSEIYSKHGREMTMISPPYDKVLWQYSLERYADILKKHYGRNIILVRLGFSGRCVRQTELRTTPARSALTKRMREMEEYFISLADPIVIDVAKLYFGDLDDSSPSAYEEFFYIHSRKIFAEILGGCTKRNFGHHDPDIFISRVLRYYDSMCARAFYSWMLDGVSAADLLIRYTSKQFVAEQRQQFVRLKAWNGTLSDIKNFPSDEPLPQQILSAAEAISSLLAGDISKPYSHYSVIFRHSMNAVSLMASLLSSKVGRKIAQHECEAVFLLKDDATELDRYLDSSPAVTVDIWGSCVCRESVNRSPSLITVDKYIFKQPCLLAFNEPVPCDVPMGPDKFGGSAWRRRTVCDALARKGTEILKDSTAEWVLVDMYDLISKLCLLDEKHLFECDSFLRRTDFYTSIKDRSRMVYLSDIKDDAQCDAAMERFAEFLKKRYNDNIILVRAHPNSHFIGLDGRLHELPDNDGTLSSKREYIARYEDMFSNLTGCYVIDIAHRFYSDDSFRMGGSHIVHYEEEFYRTCCSHINTILGGTEERYFSECDERYFTIRDKRLNSI